MLPLDTFALRLQRDTYEAWRCSDCFPVVGVLCAPRGVSSSPRDACGVVCEAAGCATACSSPEEVVLRVVAFSRFRVSGIPLGQPALSTALTQYYVEPWLDQPETWERDAPKPWMRWLARSGASDVASQERRVHASFLQLASLQEWSGDVAGSAHMACLSDMERNELLRRVKRFAPLAAERASVEPEDGCSIENDESDACLLERAYLHASASVGSVGPAPLAAFACGRGELYSFALSRLRDVSANECRRLLRGRCTSARLRLSEAHLTRTHAWLTSRLGLQR